MEKLGLDFRGLSSQAEESELDGEGIKVPSTLGGGDWLQEVDQGALSTSTAVEGRLAEAKLALTGSRAPLLAVLSGAGKPGALGRWSQGAWLFPPYWAVIRCGLPLPPVPRPGVKELPSFEGSFRRG